jgi:alpha-mannosidase
MVNTSPVFISLRQAFLACFAETWLICLFSFPYTPQLAAQQNVEKVFRLVSSLHFPRIEEWKARKGAVPGGQDPGLSEEGWESFKYEPVLGTDECWFRTELTIPERIALQPIESRQIWLVLDILGRGTAYLDGKKLGSLNPGENRLLLRNKAGAGEKLKIALNITGTHQKVEFREAVLELEGWQEAVDLAGQLHVSLFAAAKLLGNDTRQRSMALEVDPGIDRSTVTPSKKQELWQQLDLALAAVDETAVQSGKPDVFAASVRRSLERMQNVAEYLKTYTLYLVSNAHIDLAWLWRWRETVEVTHDTFQSVLELMRQYPELSFSQSQAQLYEWIRVNYPEMFEEIKARVREGRWEVVGGMWVEPDCNLISGESWIRQILYAQRFFKKYFGREIKLGWNPDSFGYNWNMPQFFLKSGINAFLTQKLLWNDTNIFPYHLFWWRGPDGSRILVYMPYIGYTNVVNPYQMVDALRQFDANTGLRSMAFMIGYGDHGGGPDKYMLEEARKLKTYPVFPQVVFGTEEDYLASLPDSVKNALPEYNNELYLEYHQGTYTSQARMKKLNGQLEQELETAEKFSALDALLTGSAYPKERLERAWKKVLFNQMHDILPGSGIAAVYRDAEENYEKAGRLAKDVTGQALYGIANRINTLVTGSGEPLVVFNALSWPRSGVLELAGDKDLLSSYGVYDHAGKRIASQVVGYDPDSAALIFRAEDIPATGYRVYELRRMPLDGGKTENRLRVSPVLLENEFLRLFVGERSGLITRIYDKRTGREMLAPGGSGNLIELLEDRPKNWDAWNIGYTGVKWRLNRADKVEVVETGPVRATIKVQRSFLGPTKPRRALATGFPSSFFTQEISLYAGSPLIEIRNRFDWWEDQILCKSAWEINVTSDSAYYEIPMAAIARPTGRSNSWDKARFEVPALRWADLSGGGFGVSLISDSKHGYDIEGRRMRITLLKSPVWPDQSVDRGTHEFRYGIWPHAGNWREGGTVKAAAEFSSPLMVYRSVPHEGSLPASGRGFIASAPDNVIVSAFKACEDGDGFIIRCYESWGLKTPAQLTLPPGAANAGETDLMEKVLRQVEIREGKIAFDLNPFEIKTFHINFSGSPISRGKN